MKRSMVWALIGAALLVGGAIAMRGPAAGWLHGAMASLHGHK